MPFVSDIHWNMWQVEQQCVQFRFSVDWKNGSLRMLNIRYKSRIFKMLFVFFRKFWILFSFVNRNTDHLLCFKYCLPYFYREKFPRYFEMYVSYYLVWLHLEVSPVHCSQPVYQESQILVSHFSVVFYNQFESLLPYVVWCDLFSFPSKKYFIRK